MASAIIPPVHVTYSQADGKFVVKSSYEERALPRAAGCRWDPTLKQWWTRDPSVAARLAEYADDTCREKLAPLKAEQDATREASRATDAKLDIPAPDGLSYLPFQRAGIAFAAQRPATLIADEMGLGKTIQAIGVINLDPSISKALVICPASLKLNWKRELDKWLTRSLSIEIADSTQWPDADIIVVNYDVLHRHETRLRETSWTLLVVDEAHYIKNPKARRSKQVYGIHASRRLFLTGTPIVNRPKELFPLIHSLDPKSWPKFFSFARRYCNAYQNRWGWDFDGAAHLDELQDRLRTTIMVRRLKKDVLTELPPKRRQVIELAANGASKLIQAERAAYGDYQDTLARLKADVELAKAEDDEGKYHTAVARLQEGARVAFTALSRVRHQTALAKVPQVIEHVRAAVSEGDYKVVVFAHHHDVINRIADAFGEHAVKLTGETPQAARQEAVDRFQSDPNVTVFVGSITAAGVGLTLTASSHVVFAELDWVPGNLSQAEDRCHRIGQRGSVLVQHLVLDGSLDARIARTLVSKQEIIDQALDQEACRQPVVPDEDTPKPRKKRGPEKPLTPQQTSAVHNALKLLAALCDGAQQLDARGFNKIDTYIGHSLAQRGSLTPKQAILGRRIVLKYHRQLPAELLAQIKGEDSEGSSKAA